MVARTLAVLFAGAVFAGCVDSDCETGPGRVCLFTDDGASVDLTSAAAAGTLTEPALLDLDAGGRLVFGAGTFRVQIHARAGAVEIEGAGTNATVLAGTRRGQPSYYGSVITVGEDAASLEIANLVIEDGSALQGGAILAEHGQPVAVRGVVLRDNEATGSNLGGGAVFVLGPLVVEDTTFARNRGDNGGAIYADGPRVSIARARFEDNEAGAGGAVLSFAEELVIDTSELRANSASSGGAVSVGVGTREVWITGSTFEANHARFSGHGGAVSLYGTTAHLRAVKLLGNTAYRGGGIYATRSTVELVDSELSANAVEAAYVAADAVGGGVLLVDTELVAKNSRLSHNRAYAVGPAVALKRVDGESVLVSEQSVFDENYDNSFSFVPAIFNHQVAADATFAPPAHTVSSFRCDLDGCR